MQRELIRLQRAISKKLIGQWLKTRFDRDHPLGAPLGFVGKINVFQLCLGFGSAYLLFKLRGQLLLLGDTGKNADPPFFHLPQVTQTHFQITQLQIIQTTSDFFAITGNERNGRTLIQ